MTAMREELATLPGVQYEFSRPALMSFAAPLQIEIAGFNLEALQLANQALLQEMSASDRFTDLKTTIELGNPPAWITGDDDHLRILLRRPDARVRYVAHYSGWGPGQLDEEMRVGGWLAGEPDADIIFGDHNEAWEKAVKQCGHDILTEMAPGARFGDPNLN